MFFSGLKMQIAGTLIVLLTLAIFLSGVVFVTFWQKGLVHAEIDHVRSFFGCVFANSNDMQNPASSVSSYDLKKMCNYASKHCVGVTLSDGQYWFASDIASIQEKSQKLAQESVVLNKEIIRLKGNPWWFFSFQKSYLIIAEPLFVAAGKEAKSVVVVLELDPIYESIFENHKAIFVYLIFNVILLTVVGFFRLIAVTVRPVERMVARSESYSDSDTLLFGGEGNRSEFGQLSTALNGMLCRIELDREKLRKTVESLETANMQLVKNQKEMVRTEKIASVGVLSAGLAHEIGNPIGIVQGYVELLQQVDICESDRQQFGQRALSELDRVNTLIRQLLDYAGSASHDMAKVNLDHLFDGLCQIVALKKYNPPITLSRAIPVDIYIMCDSESLRQVFLNCLLNAFDALESKVGDFDRHVLITAEKVRESESGQNDVYIHIEDNGTGIAEKNLKVIFDPFFTTKDPGKGTGLGLFVSHSIIDAHGGKMWVESTLGLGTTVHIKIPAYTSKRHEDHNEIADY